MRPPLSTRLVVTAVAAIFAAAEARASPNYPVEVQARLGLSYTPQCALCHTNGQTGLGTVNTPFGVSMRARGLVSGNLASLDTALAALEAEKTDSDHDGVPDIDELKAGTDPNSAGGPVTPAAYGCFNITGQGPPAGAGWLAALAAALFLRRRRAGRG